MNAGVVVRLAGAGCASLCAVLLLLVILPAGHKQDKAVFRNSQTVYLNQQSMVDRLSGLSLSLRLTRAEWTGTVLKIDLEAEENSRSDERWVEDIRQLAELSFVQTSNVSRLLVRLENHSGMVLAAVDLRRGDSWLNAEALHDWSGVHPARDPLWRSRLRLSFAADWAAEASKDGL